MTIKEKIEKEDGQSVYCYKQGVFWVAFEQSAYMICQYKNYKPTKKWIKNINKEVVTVGFPSTALEQWKDIAKTTIIEEKDNFRSYKTNNNFLAQDFITWKETIMIKLDNQTDKSIEQKIKNFPLINSTPIDAFMFIEKLQKELSINPNI